MKTSKSKIILVIILSIVLFVIGIFIHANLMELILPKQTGWVYTITSLGAIVNAAFAFSIVLGLIPLALFLTWRFGLILTKQKKLLSVVIVFVSIVIAAMIKRQAIQSDIALLTGKISAEIPGINVNYNIEHLNFEYYIFGGLCAGCLISYFILREKNLHEI